LIYSLATAACVAVLAPWQASAMPVDHMSGVQTTGVEQTQYFYGGRSYCWYDNGWRGPGFYWCGYAMRRGYGWGGGAGWRGWGGPPRMGHGGPPPRMGHGGPPPRMGRGGPPPQMGRSGGGGGGGGTRLHGTIPNPGRH
jgi:hypothetical protein